MQIQNRHPHAGTEEGNTDYMNERRIGMREKMNLFLPAGREDSLHASQGSPKWWKCETGFEVHLEPLPSKRRMDQRAAKRVGAQPVMTQTEKYRLFSQEKTNINVKLSQRRIWRWVFPRKYAQLAYQLASQQAIKFVSIVMLVNPYPFNPIIQYLFRRRPSLALGFGTYYWGLRHTMATQLLNADADLSTIQDLLRTYPHHHNPAVAGYQT